MKRLLEARGFTLIELLVTISLIAILGAIGFTGYSSYLKSAEKGKESHAARALMAGFHAYAADNGGKIIKAMDPKPGKVIDHEGKPVMSHAAKRWPWRLAPYIDYNMDILLVNNSKAAQKDDNMFSYLVTVFTTLGMNGTFVGGKYGTALSPDNPRNKNKVVTTIFQPSKPSKLIVFASAKMQGAPHPGCFDVSPQGMGGVGEVDYKYNNHAVVAYFDGHVELNSPKQLDDLSRWSNN